MSTLLYQSQLQAAQNAAAQQNALAGGMWVNTTATTAASTNVYFSNVIQTSSATGLGAPMAMTVQQILRTKIVSGEKIDIELPDGAFLHVAEDGSYKIEDKNAKITYRANRVREFNRFLNASDLLVKFIEYLNSLHLKQKEALGLPIDLFIAWLIIEAAKADDEEPQAAELAKLETLMRQHVQIDPPSPMLALPAPMPRCFCGRFMSRERAAKGLAFCTGAHMDRYESKLLVAA